MYICIWMHEFIFFIDSFYKLHSVNYVWCLRVRVYGCGRERTGVCMCVCRCKYVLIHTYMHANMHFYLSLWIVWQIPSDFEMRNDFPKLWRNFKVIISTAIVLDFLFCFIIYYKRYQDIINYLQYSLTLIHTHTNIIIHTHSHTYHEITYSYAYIHVRKYVCVCQCLCVHACTPVYHNIKKCGVLKIIKLIHVSFYFILLT